MVRIKDKRTAMSRIVVIKFIIFPWILTKTG